jgi:hypothetical protein
MKKKGSCFVLFYVKVTQELESVFEWNNALCVYDLSNQYISELL